MGGGMKRKNEKTKKWIFLIGTACVLFLAGLSIMLYPILANWLYNYDVQAQKRNFEQQVEDAQFVKDAENFENSEAIEESLQEECACEGPFDELYQELKRRNDLLYIEHQKDLKDPFSYEQPGIDLTEYGLDGNTIGFLSIPKMEIELPILLGANSENMRVGAVHLTETSYPIGGNNTNCVLAAHRGYSKAAMFRDIEVLELGDTIYIENPWETLIYQVVEIRIISPTDVQELLIQPGRDLVTLITCHPYRVNNQRYVVYCERVVEDRTILSFSKLFSS